MPVKTEDVKATLRALLDDMEGVSNWVSGQSPENKIFMLIASCAQLIEAAIVSTAQSQDDAQVGLQALNESMQRNITTTFERRGRMQ